VIEAEVHRHFRSSVNFDPASSDKEFFLVLSVGQCKFCLTVSSIQHLLVLVLDGSPAAFRVVQLGDRVFRFSVASHLIDFKDFFHLWHGGGPIFEVELCQWESEQAAEWVEVVNRNRDKPVRLSGANTIPISVSHQQASTSRSMEFSNLNTILNSRRISAFNCLNFVSGFNGHQSAKTIVPQPSHSLASILGPVPNPNRVIKGTRPLPHLCSKCLSPAHLRSTCKSTARCRRCLRFGHVFSRCYFPP
jgi:hypothetical protein